MYYLDDPIRKGTLGENRFFLFFSGAIKIKKKLDRDLPNGYPVWSTFIFAKDENGGPTGIENYVEFEVILEDINDNAPFLDMPQGLVWTENQSPGTF